MSPPAVPVILGYGRAGRDLHHRSLGVLAERGSVPAAEVVVVDPVRPLDPLPGARWLRSLPEALATLDSPASAVVHIATPVSGRTDTVRALADAGVRRVIMEKPYASTPAMARELTTVAREAGIELLPVAVWPSSTVTRHVRELLAAGRIGRLVSLHFEQSKPRFRRGLDNGAHSSAFEVEMPHQVLLALHLCGDAEVTDAEVWPLRTPAGSARALGGGGLRLRHRGGVISTLVSDLTSPTRIRRLRLWGTEGEIVAHYPIGGDDPFGQVQMTGQQDRTLCPDAPLTTFIDDSYRFFHGTGERPDGADPQLHLRVTELLAAASAAAVPRGAPPLLGPTDVHAHWE
ncbi:Gfo/Idh/MocA family oxidoreductase [Streptomyces sp. NPDC005890]|uniref:Gfo/Idh/MocA family protein n=1 Tax=Streptomyces sp. NPDC005890 TaxID=3154568 RepID=UPI0033F9E3B7